MQQPRRWRLLRHHGRESPEQRQCRRRLFKEFVAQQHARVGGGPEGNGVEMQLRRVDPSAVQGRVVVGPGDRHLGARAIALALQAEHQRLGQPGLIFGAKLEAEVVAIPTPRIGQWRERIPGRDEPQQVGVHIDQVAAERQPVFLRVDLRAIQHPAGVGIALHRGSGVDQTGGLETEGRPHGFGRSSAEIEKRHFTIGQHAGEALEELIAQLPQLQEEQGLVTINMS